MLRTFIPALLVLGALALFFGYTDGAFSRAQELAREDDQFNQALDKSRELQGIRDQLLSKYNTFTSVGLARLAKLLPDTVDNVRLTLDIDNIAAKYSARIKNVTVQSEEKAKAQDQRIVIGADQSPYGSVVLTFTTVMSYSDFVSFLRDLEVSLRLVDVVGLSFTSVQGDLYDFTVGIRTYWLK